MNLNQKTSYIDLSNLEKLADGNRDLLLKYLHQYQELTPSRLDTLERAIQSEDRVGVRQVVHQMSPQLQFFGVPNIAAIIKKIETEYESMSMDELHRVVNQFKILLQKASYDVNSVVESIQNG